MDLIDRIIERVQLLLGDTYYIRYCHNMRAECFVITAMRCDCDIDFNMTLYKTDMDIGMYHLVNFVAQEIISGFNDIIENYDEYKEEN